MKHIAWTLSIVSLFSGLSVHAKTWQPEDGRKQIAVWPGKNPRGWKLSKAEAVDVAENKVGGSTWQYITDVSKPTLTVYSPKGKNTGAAVFVYPGGGYKILAIDLEGSEICDWLNSKGITAILLKYRVPSKHTHIQSRIAMEDAQRAMRIVRKNASKWNIDKNKIGVIGFSAGGHLVAAMSNKYNQVLYKPVDSTDKVSARPNFAIAIYPGHLWTDRKKFSLNPTLPVTSKTPPTFLLQAQDDKVDPPEHSLVYYRALKRKGVPVEMHLYSKGGHAFGLRPTKNPITKWPKLVETWMAQIGVIPE